MNRSGISIFDAIHGDDLLHFESAHRNLSGSHHQGSVTARLKVNDEKWINWEFEYHQDEPGQPGRFLYFGFNETYEGEIKKYLEMKAFNGRFVENRHSDGVIIYGKKGTDPVFHQKSTEIPEHMKYSNLSSSESGHDTKGHAEVSVGQSLYTSFLNYTPYFSWIVDRDEKLLFANKSLLRYFNGDEKAYGNNIFDLIPASIATFFHRKHQSVLAKKIPIQSIVRSLMSDGKEHVFQVTVFPIHPASPDMKIGGEALDVTESWVTRQEEMEASQRLSYISKATSEAIWDWNMQTGKIFGNQALNMLLGEELDKVSDLDWCYGCIHPEDREQVEMRVKKVLDKKEQYWEQEFRFRYRDGSYKMVLKRGFVIYENEVAIRMICTLQDISEIRELEHQLVEQKLRQQKGVAEAIIRSQEMERNRIGIELHDNVNQIISTAQLFLNSLDPSREDFHDLKERTKAILSLSIEEIRKLSREMVGPNLKETGLLTSIHMLVEDIRRVNPFKITFDHGEPQSFESLGQQKKMTLLRIVQEQIKNIVRYSNASDVQISLHCYPDQVRLHISDDGIGFDAKNTPRGLGLSNIYERTRLYNGKAILHTSPGMGCSLIVNIPLDSSGFLESHER